eukprot:CAMPEP_0114359482 /NCGR_PEP_ID=MMETSP0101-20121206/23054_1 /TAXON_ID=38822 ORGANISM="Pteridomonas danica, Strain PT" /NCGR_SAMPLE_ID=MMETSP0101 /ASSEMBLY_ACC=CAM_ASM_000211 /LENGTH=366 /DNA_ID=CAMNT_0001503055 /DNA_START=154 /DNA_END=1254 /DNA_ORIENTATION=-
MNEDKDIQNSNSYLSNEANTDSFMKLAVFTCEEGSTNDEEGRDEGYHTQQQNPAVTLKPSSNYIGVCSTPYDTFRVQISINGTKVNLGSFRTEVEAARVYDKYVVDHKLKRAINFSKEHPEHVFKKRLTSSRFIGVSKQLSSSKASNVVKANISVNGRIVHIGNYATEEEAARARDNYIVEHKLKGRPLNFPQVSAPLPIVENSPDSTTNTEEEEEEEEETLEEYHTRRKSYQPISIPSQYTGVKGTVTGKFTVHIHVNKIQILLGTFPTELEAARVFDKYVVDHKLNREINFPKEHPEHVCKKSSKWSRFTGVMKSSSNSFKAHIKVNGGLVYIGTFPTEEEAARARDDYVVKHKLKRRPLNFSP